MIRAKQSLSLLIVLFIVAVAYVHSPVFLGTLAYKSPACKLLTNSLAPLLAGFGCSHRNNRITAIRTKQSVPLLIVLLIVVAAYVPSPLIIGNFTT